MSEEQNTEEARPEERDTEEYRRNAEARFASPDGSSVGIGYYDSEGNQLSPEEFQLLVARNAERLRDDEGE